MSEKGDNIRGAGHLPMHATASAKRDKFPPHGRDRRGGLRQARRHESSACDHRRIRRVSNVAGEPVAEHRLKINYSAPCCTAGGANANSIASNRWGRIGDSGGDTGIEESGQRHGGLGQPVLGKDGQQGQGRRELGQLERNARRWRQQLQTLYVQANEFQVLAGGDTGGLGATPGTHQRGLFDG